MAKRYKISIENASNLIKINILFEKCEIFGKSDAEFFVKRLTEDDILSAR